MARRLEATRRSGFEVRTAAPMRYKVLSQLQKPHGRVRLEIDAPAPAGTGVAIEGGVVGRVELANTGRSVLARGLLRGSASLTCSRCLIEFPWEFEVCFTESCALHQVDDPAKYAVGEDADDLIPILDEDVVDLTELVRQLIIVEVPLRPLCRPECAGLCPECGANLNAGPCGCAGEAVDPRWEKLRGLLDDRQD